jgi:hypothetical protein
MKVKFVTHYYRQMLGSENFERKEFAQFDAEELQSNYIEGLGVERSVALELINKWNEIASMFPTHHFTYWIER